MDEFTYFGGNKIGNPIVVESPCGHGKYRTTQMQCSDCIAGRFQDTIDMGGCKACDVGTSSKFIGASSCLGCQTGEYQDKTASTFCERCPAGRYGDALNQTSVDDCKRCGAGTYSLQGASICTGCPLGTNSSTGAATCTFVKCPKGFFREGYKCTGCPTGKFGNTSGAIDITDCFDCPRNTYSSATGVNSPEGCNDCPPGRVSNLSGLSTAGDCTSCAKGKFRAPLSGTLSVCPKGKYQDEVGQTECKLCPAGRYGVSLGSNSLNQCEPCSIGEFSLAGQDSCLGCPSGMVNPNEGASECTRCPYPEIPNPTKSECTCGVEFFRNSSGMCVSPCPVGVNCTTAGSTLYALNIKPGWWRAAENSTNMYDCPGRDATCEGGTNVSTLCGAGSTGVMCTLCKENYQRDVSTNKCVECPKSTCPGSTLQLSTSLLLNIFQLLIHVRFDPFLKAEVNTMQFTQLALVTVTSVVSLSLQSVTSLTRIEELIGGNQGHYNFLKTRKDLLATFVLILTFISYLFFAYKITRRYHKQLRVWIQKISARILSLRHRISTKGKESNLQDRKVSAPEMELKITVRNPVHSDAIKEKASSSKQFPL
eukprot:g2102.t1